MHATVVSAAIMESFGPRVLATAQRVTQTVDGSRRKSGRAMLVHALAARRHARSAVETLSSARCRRATRAASFA